MPVEVRGAGPASRQVTNFMAPDVFDGADKLMCVELLTPERQLVELPAAPSRCRLPGEQRGDLLLPDRARRHDAYDPVGFGLHRTYTADGDVDVDLHVADGDVFLVHRGYHGPASPPPATRSTT